MTHPQARKPPTKPTGPLLRYVMGADAKAGDLVDLDLGTGRLIPTDVTPVMVADASHPVTFAPTGPPPALYLRALAAGWRDQAQQARDGGPGAGKLNFQAREALDEAARQLDATLTLMGVVLPVSDEGLPGIAVTDLPCGVHLDHGGLLADDPPRGSLCFHGYGAKGEASGQDYCRAGRPIQIVSWEHP